MCELGATDLEVAAALGITFKTFYNWKGRHAEFLQALKVGKDPADEKVKRSLFQRACGYSHPEIDIRTIAVGEGMSEIVKTQITKHYPPDTAAGIFWLKNRCKEEFRQNPEGEQRVDDAAAALRALAERLPT
jgi:hypothetical protein